MEILYRASQFWHLLTAGPLTAEACVEVKRHLTTAEYELYSNYSYGDQWHTYHVVCMLQEAGHLDSDLLTAALLHDIGKTRAQFGPIWRSVVSLCNKLFPNQVMRWEEIAWGNATWWQRPFIVSAQHAVWSAEMAAAVGSSPLAVKLMYRHQDILTETVTKEDQLLACLQWADNQN